VPFLRDTYGSASSGRTWNWAVVKMMALDASSRSRPHRSKALAVAWRGQERQVTTTVPAAARLAERRAALAEQLRLVRAGSDASTASAAGLGFGKRVGDSTSIAVERISEVAAADGLQRALEQVGRAELALEEGWYGACESCGGHVGAARLEARPEATRCMGCS
jgi:DnaK suppressor protein